MLPILLLSNWVKYPTVPTLVAAPNKTFLIKQIIKMPKGTYLLPVGNATGTGGYLRVLGNKEGTGKFEVYYSVVQCGYDAPAVIHGHFRVIAGTKLITLALAVSRSKQ